MHLCLSPQADIQKLNPGGQLCLGLKRNEKKNKVWDQCFCVHKSFPKNLSVWKMLLDSNTVIQKLCSFAWWQCQGKKLFLCICVWYTAVKSRAKRQQWLQPKTGRWLKIPVNTMAPAVWPWASGKGAGPSSKEPNHCIRSRREFLLACTWTGTAGT